MLALEQFKAEIRTGIILGDLNPVNDVDLCGVIYSDKPETFWTVDISTMTVVECNVNYVPKLMKVFKFGISTADNLPYIQFPDDISQIIGDGIRIKYIRTNGVNGNIKANTLSKLEVPAI